jgi:glycolate oxidase
MSPATRRMAKHKIAEDVVVPRTEMPRLLEFVSDIGREECVRHLTYGHAGDGNLHVNFLWDKPEEQPAVLRAVDRLMRATLHLGGTLSGEHGIGLTKKKFLPLEQSGALIALESNIKRVFDPDGLLNPGKIFPVDSEGIRTGHGPC